MSEQDPSRRRAIATMVFVVILVISGIWLQRHLRAESQMEDCLLAGRRNCAPIAP